MYESYFGFREAPFDVTTNLRFFYTNERYEGALSALRYGITCRKGLILLTGEVGTGKTTLLRKLMCELEATVRSIYVFYTYLGFNELVQLILHDMGLYTGKSRLEMFREFSEDLIRHFKNGSTVALLIDEAQNLSDESLEGLRLLANLEIDNQKMLQIVLVGQPELEAKLDKPCLRQLKDRVAVRCHLDSLTRAEIGNYIHHRLRNAGYDGPEIFSNEAIECIGTYSRGTPRSINTLCDNALILAYGSSSKKVSADMIMAVAGDLGSESNLQVAKARAREVDHSLATASNNTNGHSINRRNGGDDLGSEPNLESGNVKVREHEEARPETSNDNGEPTLEHLGTGGDRGLEPKMQIANLKARELEQGRQGASTENGQNVKNTRQHRREGLRLHAPGARSQKPRPVVASQPHTAPPQFFYTMTRALAEAMGPMASVVITDQVAALGESDNAFPIGKLGQLVDLVSRSILNPVMKAAFQDFMRKEIYRDTGLSMK